MSRKLLSNHKLCSTASGEAYNYYRVWQTRFPVLKKNYYRKLFWCYIICCCFSCFCSWRTVSWNMNHLPLQTDISPKRKLIFWYKHKFINSTLLAFYWQWIHWINNQDKNSYREVKSSIIINVILYLSHFH